MLRLGSGWQNETTPWVILPEQRLLLCRVQKNAATTLMSLAHLAAGTPLPQLRVSCSAAHWQSCDAMRWFWRGLSPAAQNVSVADNITKPVDLSTPLYRGFAPQQMVSARSESIFSFK